MSVDYNSVFEENHRKSEFDYRDYNIPIRSIDEIKKELGIER